MITSKRFITLTFTSAVLFICIMLCTSGCDWFDDDDDHNHGPVVADRLDTPWELVFAPDGRLFATQRPGSIVTIANGNTKIWLALDSTALEVGESGLLGITLDPQFAQNGYVYIGYTYAASKGPLKLVNKLVRYKENANKEPVFDKVSARWHRRQLYTQQRPARVRSRRHAILGCRRPVHSGPGARPHCA